MLPLSTQPSKPAGDWRWAAALAVLPVLANLHLLLGYFSAAPLYMYSGLSPGMPRNYLPPPTIDFNIGAISEALGRRAVLELLNGSLPWWNPFEGVGMPLAGEMQSAALLPFTSLLALPDGLLYLHVLLQIIAGVFTYLFMRRVGVSPFAACAAGALFEFNGTLAWLPTEPIAFMPVILYGVEGEIGRIAGSWRWVAAGVALSLYAGFPEMAYIDGLLVAVWTLARLWALPGRALLSAGLHISAGVLSGLLLATPLLVAFWDYLSVATVVMHQHGFFSHFHMPRVDLAALFLPYAFGNIDNSANIGVLAGFWALAGGYMGIGLITLGLLGLWGRKHRPLRIVLALWAGLIWSAAYGVPIGRLMWLIPFLSNSAFYRYFDPSFAMVLIVLAAFALDDLRHSPLPGRRYWLTLALSAALLGICLFAGRHLVADAGRPLWFRASLLMAAVMFAGMVCAGLPRVSPARRRQILGGLAVAEALLNFMVPTFNNPRHPSLALGGIRFLQQHVGIQRVFSAGVLAPNYGSYFGIAEIDDCDLPLPANWLNFRMTHLDRYASALIFDGHARFPWGGPPIAEELGRNFTQYEQVGVKFVLAAPGDKPFSALPHGVPVPPAVYSDRIMTIYQLPHPRPYFDAPQCSLSPQSRTLVLSNCPASTVLTRLELYMPGWRVWVNGQRQPLAESGGLFQQVQLPAGLATVRFAFRPPFIGYAYVAFALGLLILCIPFGFPDPDKPRE